ncbi:MAG: Gfo/Idh/MocA family oxidoreductase [Pirellulales bacterium]|nr:Gfo/Idh/MocA family oxidoreductase [Pirellulales bacterium]
MKLRIGLVGLGDVWQSRHAPALRALADRFEVEAICDQVAHRAEQAAAEFDADTMDGYRTLAQREDIDAVMILSPQWYGALPILAACQSGKAVYCAAGLDLELEESEEVKRRVEEAGIAFMAEFPRRFAPATLRLKELIATHLGAPRLIFCHQRSAAPAPNHCLPPRSPHHFSARHLVELVDWCCYLVDQPPRLVTGLMHRTGCEATGDDYQMMSLDYSDPSAPGTGPVAQVSCGRYIPAGWNEATTYRPLAAMQISCVGGVAFVDLPASLIWFDAAGRHQESLETERPLGEQLLIHFYRSVTSIVRRNEDLEDACRALNIVLQARRSHQEGRRVELP